MRKRVPGGGRKPFNESLESNLMAWIDEMRSRNLRVTRKRIQKKALWLHSESGDSAPFEASDGWLHNFFTRHHITLRRKITVSQKVPAVLAPKLLSFFTFVRKLRMQHGYPLSGIGAMDETPIWLDMAADTTVDHIGSRSVPIKSTGNEKARITVCLAAKADGTKLPPFLIFKGKRPDKELLKVSGVVCVMNDKAWMNEELTQQWLSRVWGTFAFGRRLLVWDAFRCHLQDVVKDVLKKSKTDMAVIPGGCTGLIQPPDVSWNKPFKSHYWNLYEQWLAEGDEQHTFTKGGNLRAPSRVLIAQWVKSAWDSVSKEVIIKSFIVCGISNNIDGSQDSLINVIKPGAILGEESDEILKELSQVSLESDENISECIESEDYDDVVFDDSESDDDVPLAKLQ
jgi:hypothetical protein